MPDNTVLNQFKDIDDLIPGATNAVASCLRVTRGEAVTVICDEDRLRIASALVKVLDEHDARVKTYVLGRHVSRPALEVPASLLFELKRSQVCIFACSRLEDENEFRRELLQVVKILGLRHAHMLDVSDDVLIQGMAADYHVVRQINTLVKQRIRASKTARLFSDAGCDISLKISSREPMLSVGGLIEPGKWENLPSGEIYVPPALVDGVFVCDNIAPGHMPVDPVELKANPLKFHLERSHLIKMEGGPGNLAEQVQKLLDSGHNTDRIGGFIVGTNYKLADIKATGEPLLDLFRPGAYLSFGQRSSVKPKTQRWSASTEYAFCARTTSLELDDELVISNGKFTDDLMEEVMQY